MPYPKNTWVNDIPGVQEGTPIDAPNMNRIEEGISKAARTDEANNLTGDQTVVDGDIGIKSTTGTANKRWTKFKQYTDYLQLNAINDAGAIVRGLIRFFHDGLVQVLGRLQVDDAIDFNTSSGTADKRKYRMVSWADGLRVQALKDDNTFVRTLFDILHDGAMTIYYQLIVASSIITANNAGYATRKTDTSVVNVAHVDVGNVLRMGDPSIPTEIRGSDINIGGNQIKTIFPVQSTRWNDPDLLIATNIDYPVASGSAFLLEIKANSYGSVIPIDTMVQGYCYNNTLHLSTLGGLHKGKPITGLVAMGIGGKLHFWFPYQDFWGGYVVSCWDVSGSVMRNTVTALTDSPTKPVGVAEVALSPYIKRLPIVTDWKPITITPAQWTVDANIDGFYRSRYITDTDCASGDVVEFEVGYPPYYNDVNVAQNAGMGNVAFGFGNAVAFSAMTTPTSDIRLKYRIHK